MIDEATQWLDEGALRALVPRVLAGLVRRGEDFDAAVDRARANLLMTRSRFRKALRAFPGSLEGTEAGGDTSS